MPKDKKVKRTKTTIAGTGKILRGIAKRSITFKKWTMYILASLAVFELAS